jgi:hypothetical protein
MTKVALRFARFRPERYYTVDSLMSGIRLFPECAQLLNNDFHINPACRGREERFEGI